MPVVSGAILLFATKSLGMYLQQVGRVLRPKPDGSRAVILDHVANVRIHGMPCTPHEWKLENDKAKGCAPMAVCEECYRAFAVTPGWKGNESRAARLIACSLNLQSAAGVR